MKVLSFVPFYRAMFILTLQSIIYIYSNYIFSYSSYRDEQQNIMSIKLSFTSNSQEVQIVKLADSSKRNSNNITIN